MTSNEAKQKIDACEHQIVSAHSGLKDNARAVGSGAVSSSSSKTTTSTLLPLILCIIGLFCFGGPWFLGVLLIIGGIVIAYNTHNSAKSVQNKIENGQKNLNSTIDSNSNI